MLSRRIAVLWLLAVSGLLGLMAAILVAVATIWD
jgi:hypothetical protein